MPFFIIFFIIIQQQSAVQKAILFINRKRKGVERMTNELIQKYIGKNCYISSGSFGINVKGKIIDVSENWLEVETKKGNELVNSEFVQSIKII